MRRRIFIAAVGSAAVWSLAAGAQWPANRPIRIGILRSSPIPDRYLEALRHGLAAKGYVEGRDFIFVVRFGDGDARRLPELAKTLVADAVDVIVTEGLLTTQAARAATQTVPIIIAISADPRRPELVESLSRPGGNVTGLSGQGSEISGKLLELAKEMMPGLTRVAHIMPRPAWDLFRTETLAAARTLGLSVIEIDLTTDVDAALEQAVAEQAPVGVVRGRPLLSTAQAHLIVARAAAHRLPVIYESRDFVELGGLMAFGVHAPSHYERVAWYLDQIVRGAKPSELPVQQPTAFELVINLNTAKALGLSIPATLLARADEVIE
jgi:putative ABC transport system substrate-binding protein